jgi:DNA-binding NarL/FixJ family response regulator
MARLMGGAEMAEPRHTGRRWTPAEERQLQDMLDAGRTAIEISRRLKRTIQAIYAHLQRLYRRRSLHRS